MNEGETRNEEAITLLREIRDLQKLHVENYKAALKHQQTAIELQQKASRNQKRAMIGLLIFAILMICALLLLPLTSH